MAAIFYGIPEERNNQKHKNVKASLDNYSINLLIGIVIG